MDWYAKVCDICGSRSIGKMPSHPNKESIFNHACEIEDTARRAAFLADACGDDHVMRAEIEQLLQLDDQPDSLLDFELTNLDPTSDALPALEKPGDQIGSYKLLQKVGEGGMGVVYMAEQKAPVRRRVALKIIKPGMDTREVIARFEAERQALAMMDHPNIAKVLDCGTTQTGRPFFVMELVKGVSITEYCDANHLTPKERLELFVPVCQAIQHAHQKGIIHRDIKPSNILIAEYDHKAVPKIIDFGVAKALNQQLTSKTMFTQLGQLIGTIEYMSPEQAKVNQLDVDTRSDIYSLGVLLYELLSGSTPFDRKRLRSVAIDELMRIIREEDPPRPSTRLSTVETLPSIAANRKIEPKKLGALLHGELDWIVMKAMEKDRGRRYDTAAAFADDIQNYLSDAAVLACPPSSAYRFRKFARRNKVALATGVLVSAALILGIIGTSWQAFLAAQSATRANNAECVSQQRLLDERRARVDADKAREAEKVQRLIAEKNTALALANLNLALESLDGIYIEAIGERKLLSKMFPNQSVDALGESFAFQFSEEERELLERGLQFYKQFATENAGSSDAALRCASAERRVGTLYMGLGMFDEARENFQVAITHFETLVTDDSSDTQLLNEMGMACYGISLTYSDPGEMTPWMRKAETCFDRIIELEPWNTDALMWRGHIQIFTSPENAYQDIYKAIEIDPDNVEHLIYAAEQLCRGVASRYRDQESARKFAERAIRLEPDLVAAHRTLGTTYKQVRDYAASLRHYARAIEMDPGDALNYLERLRPLIGLGRYEEALADCNRIIKLAPSYGSTYSFRARIHALTGNLEEALADCDRSEKLSPRLWKISYTRGLVFREMGRLEEAVRQFDRTIEVTPNYFMGYQGRAETKELMGDYIGAFEDENKRVLLVGDDERSTWKLASLATRLRRPNEPLEDLIQRLNLDLPQNSLGLFAGDFLQRQGLLDEAITEYQTVLKADPMLLLANQRLAEIFRKRLDFETALKWADKCRDIAPRNVSTLLLRARILKSMNRFEEAIKDYGVAIGLRGEAPEYHGRGDCFRSLGQYGEAVADYEQELHLPGAKHTETFPKLIACYQQLDKVDDALERLDEIAGFETTEAEYWHRRGDFLVALGQHPLAIESYSKALEIKPDHVGSRTNRSHCLAKLGLNENAIEDYQSSKDLEFPEADFYVELGERLLGLDEYEKASDSLEKALKSGVGQHNKVFTKLIACYQKLDKVDDTLERLDEIVGFETTEAEYWHRRGDFLVVLGQHPLAIESYSKALEIKPDHAWARINRGACCVKLGEDKYAIDDYRQTRGLKNLANQSGPFEKFFFELGERLLRLEKYEIATDSLEKAISLAPQHTHYRKRAALAHFHLGQFEDAIADLKVRVEADPTDTSTIVWIPPDLVAACKDESFKAELLKLSGRLFEISNRKQWVLYDRGWIHLRCGEPEKASQCFKQAIELKPNAAPLQNKIGILYLNENQHEQARDYFSQSIKLKPDQTNAWNLRGLSYFRMGQFELARSDFGQFIKLAPENAVAWCNRAAAHKELQDFEAAIADAEAALKLNPKYTMALRLRAQSHAGLDNWDAAIKDFTDLIGLEPATVDLLLERGKAYLAAGDEQKSQLDFDQYMDAFDKAVAENPDDWGTINRRGVAQTEINRWNQAVNDFARTIALAPEEAIGWKNRAQCYCETGYWKLAVDDLSQAVGLGDSNWLTYYRLALCQLGINDLEGYRETCKRMVEVYTKTTDPVIANFAAWTCCLAPRALEDLDRALTLTRLANKLQSESLQNQNTLGTLLMRAGQTDEAIKTLMDVAEKLNDSDALANTSPAYTWYALALAHHNRGDAEQARQWLDRANQETEEVLADVENPPAWNRRATLERFRKEANALLAGVDANPEGNQPPTTSESNAAASPDQ